MSDSNYGFDGVVPPGVSIQDNVQIAQTFQNNHTPAEVAEYFYDIVRNNKDGHLPADVSMDYKQIDPIYADFGNFNYAVVGKALGFPDWALEHGAGVAQGKADGLTWSDAMLRSMWDWIDRGEIGDRPRFTLC
jgi:hypothetical protein